MEILKKFFSILKEIFVHIWLTILSLFRVEPVEKTIRIEKVSKNKKTTKKKDEIKIEGSLPDEDSVKSDDTPLSYTQSIGTVSNDIKEEILSKVNKREIYFSDIVVLKTIIEVIEKKEEFLFEELDDDKKEKIKKEVEIIQEKISPSLKKDMTDNKITTKEELKEVIDKKIDKYLYKNNTIKNILKKDDEITKTDDVNPVKDDVIEIVKEKEEVKVEVKPSTDDTTIKKEKKKQELVRLEKIDKEDKNSKENVYFMANMLKNKDKKLDMNAPTKVSDNTELIPDLSKEIVLTINDKTNKLPFIMVPSEKKDKKKMEEKIKNTIVTVPLIATSLVNNEEEEKEIVEEKGEETVVEETVNETETIELPKMKDENKKEDEIKEIELDKKILEEIKADISNKEEVKPKKDINSYTIKTIVNKMEELEKEKQNKKMDLESMDIESSDNDEDEEKEVDERVKDVLLKSAITAVASLNEEKVEKKEKVKEEDKKEKKKEEVKVEIKAKEKVASKGKIDSRVLSNYDIQYNNAKDKFEVEKEKEDFEDRDYEKIDNKIDDILYNIEMFEIQNEDKLTEEDKESIVTLRKRLNGLKTNVNNQKESDLEVERKFLEASITKKELDSLQSKIKKMHLEHQEELDNLLIKKIKDIENFSDQEIEDKEVMLIKSKLRKAAEVAEIPSIIALPFVRNRYFFYFTIGLFINNHFNFLNSVFNRKDVSYEPVDLSQMRKGKDSLEQSISITYKNLVYLDYLEEESLKKYPFLKRDPEFISYISRIREKLEKNYDKLNKKQKMIDKYISKINRRNKVYKKYKLIREDKNS